MAKNILFQKVNKLENADGWTVILTPPRKLPPLELIFETETLVEFATELVIAVVGSSVKPKSSFKSACVIAPRVFFDTWDYILKLFHSCIYILDFYPIFERKITIW